MSRFRPVVFLTFAFFAAAPLTAQGRQERVRTTDQAWDRHSRDRSDRRGRDTCVDVDRNRDGQCDTRASEPRRRTPRVLQAIIFGRSSTA